MAAVIPEEGLGEFSTLKLSFDRTRSEVREQIMLKAQGVLKRIGKLKVEHLYVGSLAPNLVC